MKIKLEEKWLLGWPKIQAKSFLGELEKIWKMKILVIYQFCSFGGVERVILNRAKTFRKYHHDVNISVGYLNDYGALQSFQAYIQANKLDDYLSAFLMYDDKFPDLNQYDFVFNIDTPQVFERTSNANNMFVECHTPTVNNRQYLKTLPENVRGILVPSSAFKSILHREFQSLNPIFVLPNPVAEEFFDIPFSISDRIYSKTPLAYLARVDDGMKNFSEAMGIFAMFANDEKVMFAVVGRGVEDVNLLDELEKINIVGKTFLRDRIDFDVIPYFIRMIKTHHGVFISPSKGESFGLSAAEFISAGVPVLLSDIASHRELVDNDEKFIYRLGDIHSASENIVWIMNHWDEASKIIISYAQKFNGVAFITAWQNFLDVQK